MQLGSESQSDSIGSLSTYLSTLIFRCEKDDGSDIEGISKVLSDAFKGEAEAKLVNLLRQQKRYDYRLSRVAIDPNNQEIVGYCLLNNIELSHTVEQVQTLRATISVLSLAPVAVASRCQKAGIGSKLIRDTLSIAAELGHQFVFVLGHIDYYPRFGFESSLVNNIECIYSGPHLMGLEFQAANKGALQKLKDAKLQYSEPFSQV
jgi:putative acetyltransferase